MVREFDPFVPIVDKPIATFDDQIAESALVKLETAITPVQDLNGYSKPWAAGKGKNKFNKDDSSITANARISTGNGGTYSSSDSSVSYYLAVTAGQTYALTTGRTAYYAWYDEDKTFISGGNWADQGANPAPTGAAFIRFDFATANIGAVQFEAGSSATSYAPYSNVCPISGYTGAEIFVFNKNLVSSSIASASIEGTGVISSSDSYKLFVAPVKKGVTYTITTNDNTAVVYAFFSSSPTMGATSYNGSRVVDTSSQTTIDITAPLTGYIAFRALTAFANGQLELGDQSTYTAHDGTTITANWNTAAGTIYAGTWNVLTGVLTSRMANIASYNGEDINEPWISSMDEYAAGATPTTGAQVVYTLAEPLTYELTPETVNTLSGVNNIWSTSGNITVYYPIDISYFRRYFMVNSGYILLDGGGIDLTSDDPQLIAGSWDRTVTAMETGKPIWSFNTKYGTGKPLTPVPVFCWYLSATSIVIVGATLHIIVSNTDYCVVQDVASD